ncbi:hypothetical protein AB0D12_34105 [Streptomyces sp. NPDC048479]|uniref:hypothetical protein n=1 Tax=Streptomyces sp. NPDC048479 TaxID=3154725 RepID=UPI003413373F
MTAPSTGQPTPDPEAGIERLERFLAAESERTQARKAAETFADRMPCLTWAEREQLLRLYTGERLVEAQRLRNRLAQQEAAHESRERLRGRCIKVALLLGAVSAALTLWLMLGILQ